MPRLARRPGQAAPDLLGGHDRRLEALEWSSPVVPAATLPLNPSRGERALLSHATGVWEFVWNGTLWTFTGGADLVGFTAAEATYNAAVYPASPQGPSVTLPRGGVFDIWVEARHRHAHTAPLFTAMSVGPTGSSDAFLVALERAPVLSAGTFTYQGWWYQGFALGVGAVHLWFRAPSGGGINTFYLNRMIRVRPRTLT